MYPKTDILINEISKRFKVKPKEIILGCGSEQLIKLICQTFMQKNDTSLIQRGSFAMFTKECLLSKARIKFFQPGESIGFNNAKLIFICNPNNPTGEVINQGVIENIVKSAKNSIVVVDEANGEFINDTFIPKAVISNNCIVLKTFSKAFGLAGVRLGFAIGPTTLIQKLTAVQQSFPVSSIACKLAQAALSDNRFIEKTVGFIKKERAFLTIELRKRNLSVAKSVTNNLFILSPFADRIVSELDRLGVSVVSGSQFPGIKKSGFRITIKNKKTNRLFLSKLDEVLSCMKQKKLIPSDKGATL